jgi:hypothetical protein
LNNWEAQLQVDRHPATVAMKKTGSGVYGGLDLEVEGVEKRWLGERTALLLVRHDDASLGKKLESDWEQIWSSLLNAGEDVALNRSSACRGMWLNICVL